MNPNDALYPNQSRDCFQTRRAYIFLIEEVHAHIYPFFYLTTNCEIIKPTYGRNIKVEDNITQ